MMRRVSVMALLGLPVMSHGFSSSPSIASVRQASCLMISDSGGDWQNDSTGGDKNLWKTSEEEAEADPSSFAVQEDWQELLARKNDGSFWSDFVPSEEGEGDDSNSDKDNLSSSANNGDDSFLDQEANAWLDTLASISAEEVEFNMVEAERADKARQMEEWGFDSESISNTFGVATDDSLEKPEVAGMQNFLEDSYWDDEDWKQVESHSKVEKDTETGEPIRQQMVSCC